MSYDKWKHSRPHVATYADWYERADLMEDRHKEKNNRFDSVGTINFYNYLKGHVIVPIYLAYY